MKKFAMHAYGRFRMDTTIEAGSQKEAEEKAVLLLQQYNHGGVDLDYDDFDLQEAVSEFDLKQRVSRCTDKDELRRIAGALGLEFIE